VDWFFNAHSLSVATGAKKAGYEVHVATTFTKPELNLKKHGFHLHQLKLERSKHGIVTILKEFRQIYKLIKIVRPHILHLVTIKPVIMGGAIAHFTSTKAIICAIPGMGFMFIDKGILTSIKRFILSTLYYVSLGFHKNIKIVVENTENQRYVRKLTKHKIDKFIILPVGVDLKLYNFVPESNDPPKVILGGRLLHTKGVGEFVKAARKLRNSHPRARFILVGNTDPGNPSSLTENQLKSWNDEGVIEWWGTRDDMPQVIANSHLIVLPSYYGEGLPKILMEASASGRAIVATDWPGCRDAIEPKVTGLLVPVRNSEALAKAIHQLLEDVPLRQAMGQAGRQRAEKLFPIERIVESHLAIYHQLSNAKGEQNADRTIIKIITK
jgi:glycosyltransferase involved in cell wall biosynthesis